MEVPEQPGIREYQEFFATLGPSDEHVLALAPYMVGGTNDQLAHTSEAGILEHIVIELDEHYTSASGHSRKLSNVLLNVREAIRAKDVGKLGEVASIPITASSIPTADNPLLMAMHVVVLLAGIYKQTEVQLTEREAFVLRELFLLNLEEDSIDRSELEQRLQGNMTSEDVQSALTNLAKLSAIILSMDDVLLNETIEFRKKSQ